MPYDAARVGASALQRLKAFTRETAGGVMALNAPALPVLMGAAALSVDQAVWYAEKRLLQDAADAGGVVTVAYPPASGSMVGAGDAVEVAVEARSPVSSPA
ncbi:MAG: hypothetical protein RIB45_15565 [Marivibrio sp.]|uniref:hypothetical protein n=1 Tax=Marivibrio sp. TaxID=2039719 RepID=UPI0032EB63FF